VLLDLIGTKKTQFHNFYLYQAPKWYFYLTGIEKRLATSNLLLQNKNQPLYFLPYNNYQRIEDDHIPFIDRGLYLLYNYCCIKEQFFYFDNYIVIVFLGVRTLHLISLPFPVMWHTVKDDITALDFKAISDISTILSIFVVEYLNLRV
jgi:glutaminyl-peptide cyclotransferase